MQKSRLLFLTLTVLLVSTIAHATQMPEFTGQWANGGPYTKEGVLGNGKVILLYFFEEG